MTTYNLLFFFLRYFGYAWYFNVIPDEMFKGHLLKAAAISFVIMLLVIMITILLVTITRNIQIAHCRLFLSFIIGNLSFTGLHAFFEIKESLGAKDENI